MCRPLFRALGICKPLFRFTPVTIPCVCCVSIPRALILQTMYALLLLVQFNDDVTLHGVQSGAKLQEMLDNVTKVMNMLTNARVQHLFLIKGSPRLPTLAPPIVIMLATPLLTPPLRYLDRLSQSLLQHQELANRAASQADVYHGKGEEAGVMVGQLEPQLAVLVQRTKHLQGKVGHVISTVAPPSKRCEGGVISLMSCDVRMLNHHFLMSYVGNV